MSSAPHPPGYNGGYPTNASTGDDLATGATREADDIDKLIRMAEAGIKPPKKDEASPTTIPNPIAPVQCVEPTQTPAPASAEKPKPARKK